MRYFNYPTWPGDAANRLTRGGADLNHLTRDRIVECLAFTADAENKKYIGQLDTSAGVAVFIGARADPASWFAVGRACQRFALQATALGLKCSFVNQPVEVASFRPELATLVGMPGQRPDIVMRYGYGPNLPMSPRRPVADVIDT